jgi:hypothetical protein
MADNNTPSKKTFAERAASEPTELHKAFAKWIEEKTGITPDLKTVQLASVLRMDFQRSDENQAALKDRKAEAAKKAEEAKAKRLAKLEAELAKLTGGDATDEPKPEEPTEAPKADAEPEGTGEAENGAETATEAVEKPKAPVRRTRRTAAKK